MFELFHYPAIVVGIGAVRSQKPRERFLNYRASQGLARTTLQRYAQELLVVVAASDFSRIRNADLWRSTIDRLMSIIDRLGARIE